MTPGIADTFALIFYFIFWGAIFAMVNYTLASMWGLDGFNFPLIAICAGVASYVTVYTGKIGS